MGNTSFFKITEGGQTTCYEAKGIGNLIDALAALDRAVSMEGDGQTLKDALLSCSGDCTLLSAQQWERIAEEQKSAVSGEFLAEIDVDRSAASFSYASNGRRMMVAGDIARLSGCYELSLGNGKLDRGQLAEELAYHCSVQIIGEQGGPAFGGMTM